MRERNWRKKGEKRKKGEIIEVGKAQ